MQHRVMSDFGRELLTFHVSNDYLLISNTPTWSLTAMRLREKGSERLRASIRGTVPGVVTSVLAILGIPVVLLLLSQVLSGDTYLDGVIAMVAQWSIFLVAIAVGLGLAMQLDGGTLARYGLAIDRRWVVNFVVGFGMGILVTLVYVSYGVNRGYFELYPGRIAEFGKIPLGYLLAIIIGIQVFVFLQVVWEELVFRSVMLQNYAEGLVARGVSPTWSVGAAALGSLLFFGLYHLPTHGPLFWYTIGVGGIFVVAYLVTGRLDLAIGIHFGRFMEELQGEEIAAFELPALFEITQSSMMGSLEILAVEFAVSCLLILAWGYLTNGSLGIASQVYDATDPNN